MYKYLEIIFFLISDNYAERHIQWEKQFPAQRIFHGIIRVWKKDLVRVTNEIQF